MFYHKLCHVPYSQQIHQSELYALTQKGPTWATCISNIDNINGRDVQRKNVVNVNDLGMSSLREPWQNGPYTNKRTEQHKNTKTQQTFRQTAIFMFFGCMFLKCSPLSNAQRHCNLLLRQFNAKHLSSREWTCYVSYIWYCLLDQVKCYFIS